MKAFILAGFGSGLLGMTLFEFPKSAVLGLAVYFIVTAILAGIEQGSGQ